MIPLLALELAEVNPKVWVYLVWLGQGFYFSRFLIQWIASERSGRSETPRIFWWFSLCGALFAGAGALGQQVWVLLPAFGVNLGLYIRNLFLSKERSDSKEIGLGPIPAAIAGAVIAAVVLWFGAGGAKITGDVHIALFIAGIGGQAIWGTRFIVQWWYSERKGRSHFPLSFWWISILGALLNLAYTSGLGKPEFMVAYLVAWFVPVRNLTLEYRRRKAPLLPKPPTST